MPRSSTSGSRVLVAALVVLGTAGIGIWGGVTNAAPAKKMQKVAAPAFDIMVKTVPEHTPTALVPQEASLNVYTYDFTNTTVNPISISSITFAARQLGATQGMMATSTLCNVPYVSLKEGEGPTPTTIASYKAVSKDPKNPVVIDGFESMIGPNQTKRFWLIAHTNTYHESGAAACTYSFQIAPKLVMANDVLTDARRRVAVSGAVPSITVYPAMPTIKYVPTSTPLTGVGASPVQTRVMESRVGHTPQHILPLWMNVEEVPYTLRSIGLTVDTTIKSPAAHTPYVLSVYKDSVSPANLLAQKSYVAGPKDLGSKNDDVVFTDAEFKDVVVNSISNAFPLIVTLDTHAATSGDTLSVQINPAKVVWSVYTAPSVVGLPLWAVEHSPNTVQF
ncbi:MAG: hypothetical protein AAB384_01440 [Patescibacteria group bacterium]